MEAYTIAFSNQSRHIFFENILRRKLSEIYKDFWNHASRTPIAPYFQKLQCHIFLVLKLGNPAKNWSTLVNKHINHEIRFRNAALVAMDGEG